MNNDNMYYEKYLKYKNKYFELLDLIQKGGVNHPACSVIKKNLLFPTIVIKDKIGFIYYDAKYDPNTRYYSAKWCNNPDMGEWMINENIIISEQIINNRDELLKICQCL